jgi:predicted acyl esterase
MLRAQGYRVGSSFDAPAVPADTASERVAPYEPSFEARVEMADGVTLATDVYLPPGAGSRGTPAVLIRTPYGRRGEIDAVPDGARMLNAHGFAVVAQDVRGKFDSDGSREPFLHEFADGLATLEWISAQSWSDGSAVPLGASYTGFTAWSAAASGHPAVRGAVVRMTTCHIASGWLFRQGLFRLQMNGAWARFAWSGAELEPFEPDWGIRPLSALGLGPEAEALIRSWLEAAPDPSWWARHCLGGAAVLSRRVTVPVLHWGGWWDLLSRGQLQEWHTLADVAGAGDQQLIMGATDHDFHPFAEISDSPPGAPPPELRERRVEVDLEPALPFLSTVARGEAPGTSARWELTHDGWREGHAWPPPDRHSVRLYLADGAHAAYGPEGGVLAHRPDTLPITVGWLHDPSNLVPSLESFVWGTLAHDYPDERDAQVRDDVLTFSGQPVADPLDMVGVINVRLQVWAACEQTQIAATLADVQPDGRALRILDGACLVRHASTWQTIEIELGPTAYRLRPDHRLRLSIAASSFPRYLWTSGDGLDPWSNDAGVPVEHRIQLGRASHLELSVLH